MAPARGAVRAGRDRAAADQVRPPHGLSRAPGVDALERPGTLATVTGWGNTIQQPVGPGGGGINYPDRMREAQVPIVSRPECQTVYSNVGAPIDATRSRGAYR